MQRSAPITQNPTRGATCGATGGRCSKESSVVRGMSTFPDRLRRLREHHQLKRCVLSELCGLNRNTIKRYEMGTQKPSMDALISIADYFGVSIDYLLGRSDYPKSL